jgi:hypothetical protein
VAVGRRTERRRLVISGGGEDGSSVEIGGQVMTQAQYDAARFPLVTTLDAERKEWAEQARHAARRIGEANRHRDLMRPVVAAARTYIESVDSTDPTITMGDRQRNMAELRRALRAEMDGGS